MSTNSGEGQVVTNSLILCGWIKHTKKGIVCQENRTLVITNSNHAYFVKILGRGFQEEADTKIDIVCQWKLSLRDTLSG